MDLFSFFALVFIVGSATIAGVALNWAWCKGSWASVAKKFPKDKLIVIAIVSFSILFFAVSGGFLWFFYTYLLSPIDSLYEAVDGQIEGIKIGDDAFQNVSLSIGGSITLAIALLGVILTVIRNILTRQQNNTDEQRLVTEQISRAVEQTGSYKQDAGGGKHEPNIEVRLGGLYFLQRIMQNNPKDEVTIAKILYAYVRENTKRDEDTIKKDKEEQFKQLRVKKSVQEIHDERIVTHPREDMRAVLDIISQFNKRWQEQGKKISDDMKINFSRTDLKGYPLFNMNFSGAILVEANCSSTLIGDIDLSDANLFMADFSCVLLSNANLSGAKLYNTHLPNVVFVNVDLSSAKLVGAYLFNARFTDVDLKDTDLTGACLYSADLSDAKNMTQKQISNVFGDKDTKLPKNLTYPKHWQNK